MAAARSASGEAVRRHDRERYLTALFVPADHREDLLALYAFNLEVAKTREVVREPMLGQIRLQWWRDALEEIYGGKAPRRHEVVQPLADAIRRRNLPRAPFERLLLARERDLDEAPVATLAALEAYADSTAGELVALALAVLGVDDPATHLRARSVGRGYALTGLLRAVAFHARQGRCLLPVDVLAASGTDRDAVLAMQRSPALASAVAGIAAVAAAALVPARVAAVAWPALAPAVLARRHLRRLKRAGDNVFDPRFSAEPGAGAVVALIAASIVGRA